MKNMCTFVRIEASEMKSALSNLKEVEERIEDELRRSPSYLNEGGNGFDDPEYFTET
jgi:hypothetical protein